MRLAARQPANTSFGEIVVFDIIPGVAAAQSSRILVFTGQRSGMRDVIGLAVPKRQGPASVSSPDLGPLHGTGKLFVKIRL
ncbi:hypothetical protein BJF92_09040 [Rhizobium rhizosphaerae]|uniref:Uncharacterized protein n=1 Tax=Xaviernesmea rhizosphaerae TaxID=1672749 RepID=A0A1Q9AKG5_9HYPH|nr:hypothetical protein BJF92_09040 [Xaviernesmea rhizosphaerae]